MAETIEVLVTEFRADIKRFEASMRRQALASEKAANRQVRAFQKANKSVVESTEGMTRDVRRAVAGIALGAAIREVSQYADSWVELNNKIAAAGVVANRDGRGVLELAAQARTARQEIEPYPDLYARLLRSSGDIAENEEDVAKATNLAAKAFKAGGASAQEQAAGILQLGQALGSGFLQGDELRSIRENAPLVALAIADAMEVSIGELKALGAEGELTSQIVFDALLSAEESIESAFGATLPLATDEARLALDNLNLRIGEFAQETGLVEAPANALADVLNFVADNLDVFVDALIVAGSTLGAALGAAATLKIVAGIQAIGVSLRSTVAAMGLLRAASAFMFGPVGLIVGIAAAAGMFAYMSLETEGLADAMNALGGTLDRVSVINEEIKADTARLKVLNDALTESVRKQGGEYENTALLEIDALNKRIAKNKELLEVQRLLAADRISEVREEFTEADTSFRSRFSTLQKVYTPTEFQGVPGTRREGQQTPLTDDDIIEVREGLSEKVNGGFRLSDREQEFLRELEDKEKVLAKLEELEQRYDELISGDEPGATGDSDQPANASPKTDAEDPKTSAAIKAEQRALDQLKDAYRKTFESEREMIARIRDERLKAIDASSKSEEQKAVMRSQANAIHQKELGDIKDAEAATFDQWVDQQLEKDDAVRRQAQAELDFIARLQAARDEMHGRALTIVEREYEARRQSIETEIMDETRKSEALKLLEDERAEYIKNLRSDLLDTGSGDEEIDRVRVLEEEKLAALREAMELEIITREEFAERKISLEQETEDALAEIRAKSAQVQLGASEKLFGSLADLAKGFAGEQSTIYKALFAIEKAFAIASSLVAIQTGVAQALSLPFPANLGAAATVAAAGASIVSNIQSVAGTGFADGVVGLRGPGTGRSDDIPARLSRGESVVTASGTARNAALLSAINAGADVQGALASGALGGGRAVSVTSGPVIIEGNVDQDVFERLQVELARRDASLVDSVNRIVDRSNRIRTPRHQR